MQTGYLSEPGLNDYKIQAAYLSEL